MPNANTFPDGQRGRVRPGDTSRVGAYAASTLPVRGPGITGRQFPQGTTLVQPRRRGGGGGTASNYPFGPYLSPSATGAAAGRTIMVGAGFVVGLSGYRFPLRRNIQIVVPANCTTGYFVWLKADLAPTTGDMTALDYGHGTDLPVQAAPDTTTGLLPSVVYLPLFYVTSTATGLDDWSRNLMVRSCLKLVPIQAGYSATEATRTMDWQAINSDESFDPTVFQAG